MFLGSLFDDRVDIHVNDKFVNLNQALAGWGSAVNPAAVNPRR